MIQAAFSADKTKAENSRLIDEFLPIEEVNVLAAYEMSFKLVPREVREGLKRLYGVEGKSLGSLARINNLAYYPARRPSPVARAVVLAAVAPAGADRELFLRALGIEWAKSIVKVTKRYPSPFAIPPDLDAVKKLVGRDPADVVVVDPMAGGGIIPLEAKRLGFTVVAGDANPYAYLLLRAAVEFPAKYGQRLYELARVEFEKMAKWIEDELAKYYPNDGRNLIYVPVVEHACGHRIPLVKEFALNRGKGVYLSWSVEGGEVEFGVSNAKPPSLGVCPFCGGPVNHEVLQRRWAAEHAKLIDRLLTGDESAADDVRKLYKLAAVSISSSKYRPPTPKDEELLVEAARELARAAREGAALYLPVGEIPEDNGVFGGLRRYGLTRWVHLFSPRQLLVLYTLTRYIAERTRVLKEAYGELGVATALYLALSLTKVVDYNSILTNWHSGTGVISHLIAFHYALGRKARLGYDFAEGVIPRNTGFLFGLDVEEGDEEVGEGGGGGILPVLVVLVGHFGVGGRWREGRDGVYLWDARSLPEELNGVADAVVVDPPYFDQHDYTGISELFWAVLRPALMPALPDLFPPERVRIDWSPFDDRLPRLELRGSPKSSDFVRGLSQSLASMARLLKPGAPLVVFYAYQGLEGWERFFESVYAAGLSVDKTWQVYAEAPQRFVASAGRVLFTNLVAVARQRQREVLLSVEAPQFVEEVKRRTRSGFNSVACVYSSRLKEALVVAIADGISAVTAFELPGASLNTVDGYTEFRKMTGRALSASAHEAISVVVEGVACKGQAGGTGHAANIDTPSLFYMLLLAVSEPKNGVMVVDHDFAHRLLQVAKLPPSLFLSSYRKGDADVLRPVDEVARRGREMPAASAALQLIRRVSDAYAKLGIKSALLVAREAPYEVVAFARALIRVAGGKLGIENVGEVAKILEQV